MTVINKNSIYKTKATFVPDFQKATFSGVLKTAIYCHVFYPTRTPVGSHLRQYQGFDVNDYYGTLATLDMEPHRCLQHWGNKK